MYFYKYFLLLTFTLQIKQIISKRNKELHVSKKGISVVSSSSVGLVMFADIDNTSNDDFDVEVSPDECCVGGGREDCESIMVIGDCVGTIPRGTTKSFKFVAPLIDPFERQGHCIFYLDSSPKGRQRGIMRDTIKILFDTRIKNSKQILENAENVAICDNIDEDPFNDCKPVDCETYYNGNKPYFDKKSKRCNNVPDCTSDDNEEVPNIIYNAVTNKCIIGKSITDTDVNLIKDLIGKQRKGKDILIIINDVHTTLKPVTHLKTNKIDSETKNASKVLKFETKPHLLCVDKSKIEKFKKYAITNQWTILFFGGIILMQCCLICTMFYRMGDTCVTDKKKKVVRKFYNYRQDVSVTTPLICTSNIDTATTDFQDNESNIDNKIKCYKACLKEKYENVKMSMSDDILSKCLTRRDWNSKPTKPDATPADAIKADAILEEIKIDDSKRDTNQTIQQYNESYETNTSDLSIERNSSSAKVSYEDEISKSKSNKNCRKFVKKIVNIIDCKHSKKDSNSHDENLSEKEIKSLSYNDIGQTNTTGFKVSSNKRLGFFKSHQHKKPTSMSTEKGAQASFRDSIDDLLSETCLTYFPEDVSKYSLFNRSDDRNSSLSSDISSKTSKHQKVLKNVLSLLQNRSKHGPLSDPGAKKSSELDVELLHMSQASLYSSNNDSNCLKSLKFTKDSRSSL